MNGDLFQSMQSDLFDTQVAEPVSENIKDEIQALKKRLMKLLAKTDDFRLLERVPITKPGIRLPFKLEEACGDEIPIVFLDTETTGLATNNDTIIELGLVRASFSPSRKQLVSIDSIMNAYEDPGIPIPLFITELTGITDEKVRGQRIDETIVSEYLKDSYLIVAHNAAFDRPFFEKRFKGFEDYRWACSLKGINWKGLGFKKRKLEDLLLQSGCFYEAHRASIDCLALAWLLHLQKEAFADMLEQAEKKTVIVRAFGAPFDAKDALKMRNYRWHDGTTGPSRHWWKEIDYEALDNEKAFLDGLYPDASDMASFSFKTAENRFKNS